jgi:molybdenum cofactor synthesis domain-containing protein
MSAKQDTDLTIKTAAMIVIGDEILSGRTQDKNISFVATELGTIGVQMKEVRVIPDVTLEIVDALNYCRAKYDYVFTTGGIGPTHDDITADSVAAAFGVAINHHPDAMALLTEHYKKSGVEFNDARKRMARIPDGALLVDNPVSIAPGFNIENVYVMAGVPQIMQAMMGSILPSLQGGAKMISKTVRVSMPEGKVAQTLGTLQKKYPDVSMGSYPYFKEGRIGTNLVFRSIYDGKLDDAFKNLITYLDGEGVDYDAD